MVRFFTVSSHVAAVGALDSVAQHVVSLEWLIEANKVVGGKPRIIHEPAYVFYGRSNVTAHPFSFSSFFSFFFFSLPIMAYIP